MSRPFPLQILALAALLVALWSLKAEAAPLSGSQAETVSGHVKKALRAEETDVVRAFLHLREALRLEQLYSGNTLGEDSTASAAMERFSTRLVRGNNDRLLRILHAKNVPLPDKLSLIHLLEEEVILNYPGVGSDRLLMGYD